MGARGRDFSLAGRGCRKVTLSGCWISLGYLFTIRYTSQKKSLGREGGGTWIFPASS
jgi:hypothetical protein